MRLLAKSAGFFPRQKSPRQKFAATLNLALEPFTSLFKMSTATNADSHMHTKLAMIGSGSFGSAMAHRISYALQQKQNERGGTSQLMLYARRQKIVDEINEQRTNVQYLPYEPSDDDKEKTGSQGLFTQNVSASASVTECVADAKVVFLAMPSAYLPPILQQIQENQVLREDAIIVSLAKSLHYDPVNNVLKSVVNEVKEVFPTHPVMALSGPNIYSEMSSMSEFAETTIGYDDGDFSSAKYVADISSSQNLKVSLCDDRIGVEVCGGLKNVISLASGYCEGLGLGWNTKAAVIRAGQHEIARFIESFDLGKPDTMFKSSAGVGDLILTLSAGRGRMLASAFTKDVLKSDEAMDSNGDSDKIKELSVQRWERLESELLNGMKLPDWHNAQEIYQALKHRGILHEFPLIDAIYKIGFQSQDPRSIIHSLSESIDISDKKDKSKYMK